MPIKIQRDDQTAINLTPMIDIVFLLLIFFMVGWKFSHLSHQEQDISIKVPAVATGTAMTQQPRHRVINVASTGAVSLDSATVTMTELETELKSAKSNFPGIAVVVRGDAKCPYEQVARVIATCQSAEIRNLNISVREAALLR